MTYIIETKGMLVDHISFMRAILPDAIPESFPDMTVESEFRQLNEGIEALRKKLGVEAYGRCAALANEAHVVYLAGEKDQGEEILSKMVDVITGVKTTRLRDIVAINFIGDTDKYSE